MLEGAVDFMASQLSNPSADTGVMEKVGSSLMHGIGNVLSATSEDARAEPGETGDSKGAANKEEVSVHFGKVLYLEMFGNGRFPSCISPLLQSES